MESTSGPREITSETHTTQGAYFSSETIISIIDPLVPGCNVLAIDPLEHGKSFNNRIYFLKTYVPEDLVLHGLKNGTVNELALKLNGKFLDQTKSENELSCLSVLSISCPKFRHQGCLPGLTARISSFISWSSLVPWQQRIWRLIPVSTGNPKAGFSWLDFRGFLYRRWIWIQTGSKSPESNWRIWSTTGDSRSLLEPVLETWNQRSTLERGNVTFSIGRNHSAPVAWERGTGEQEATLERPPEVERNWFGSNLAIGRRLLKFLQSEHPPHGCGCKPSAQKKGLLP